MLVKPHSQDSHNRIKRVPGNESGLVVQPIPEPADSEFNFYVPDPLGIMRQRTADDVL
jgi:hypothetical protein